jgi:hypothetical protein
MTDCCLLLLGRGNGSADHCVKGLRVLGWWDLHSRPLSWNRRQLNGIAKGMACRLTDLLNGKVADQHTMLVLKGTHAVLTFLFVIAGNTSCLLIRLVP